MALRDPLPQLIFGAQWKTMRHSDRQIDEAAQRFEELAVALDPDTAKVEDLSDLNAVAAASQAVQSRRSPSPAGGARRP
jgi:hypothetical protein